MRLIAIFVVLFGIGHYAGFAQSPHPILQSFNAYKQPNGVLLRWVIKGGNQCNGTKVFRSLDKVEFEQINHIAGICGNFTENETYTYFDTVPHPNAYDHYRLELGFQGFSETITVFFEDFGSSDHVVLTDVESRSHRILFSNDLNNKAVLQVLIDLGNRFMRMSVPIAISKSHRLDGPRAFTSFE